MRKVIICLGLLMLAGCKDLQETSAIMHENGNVEVTNGVPNWAKAETNGNCDYSIKENDFHSEGTFGEGCYWQISSRDNLYYLSVTNKGDFKMQQLASYDIALKLTNEFYSSGFGCK